MSFVAVSTINSQPVVTALIVLTKKILYLVYLSFCIICSVFSFVWVINKVFILFGNLNLS